MKKRNGIALLAADPEGAGAATERFGQTPCSDIGALDREALLALWRTCFGASAPKGISLTFLRRFLAFELQARTEGAVPASLLAKLGRIDAGQDRAATPVLKAGGRLLREWNGVTHVVDVMPGGYLWQGQCHRSLSAIARAITGAHWSGPRFFGLKEIKAGKSSAAPSEARRCKATAR